MVLSLINILVMGAMFVYMVSRAHFATARRMALIPLGVCVVEMVMFGALSVTLFPALTVLLTALRAVILLCCMQAMRRDARLCRAQARRKRAGVAAAVETATRAVSVAPVCALSRCA